MEFPMLAALNSVTYGVFLSYPRVTFQSVVTSCTQVCVMVVNWIYGFPNGTSSSSPYHYHMVIFQSLRCLMPGYGTISRFHWSQIWAYGLSELIQFPVISSSYHYTRWLLLFQSFTYGSNTSISHHITKYGFLQKWFQSYYAAITSIA